MGQPEYEGGGGEAERGAIPPETPLNQQIQRGEEEGITPA